MRGGVGDGRADIGGSEEAASFSGGEISDFYGSHPGQGEWVGGRGASALGDSFERFGSDQADRGAEFAGGLSGAKKSQAQGRGGKISGSRGREESFGGDDFRAGGGVGIVEKKRSLGLKDDLRGQYLSAESKEGLVLGIKEIREAYGVTLDFCCERLQLNRERYGRWVRLHRQRGRYGGGRPGPRKVPHALLPEEKARIIVLSREEVYGDLTHRQLAVMASETDQVQASASSFYRVMKREGLMERGKQKVREPQQKPEVKPQRPNEVWSWDLTYLALGPVFVYLFAIIDVYSRKIVGWHLSFNATLESMKRAWDKALSNEGLLGVTKGPLLPTALSDHGVQMAKKTARQFFRDLGIGQLFARYQTPTDNAWVESWFRILKYDWLRFKDYVSFDELESILGEFIRFYNTQRYHGAIGYVTPEQRHNGC